MTTNKDRPFSPHDIPGLVLWIDATGEFPGLPEQSKPRLAPWWKRLAHRMRRWTLTP